MRRILRELDAIEDSLREHGTVALAKIVEDTSEWASGRVGVNAGLAFGSSQIHRVNKHVVKYVIKRFGDDAIIFSDLISGLSFELRNELTSGISSSIMLRNDI